MRSFQKRKTKRELMFWLATGIAVVLIFGIGARFYDIYSESRKAVRENEGVEKELADLKERKSKLEVEIEHLSTKQGLEEELRKRFEVGKPGEEVLVIIDNAENAGQGAVQNPQQSFWRTLLAFIKSMWQ